MFIFSRLLASVLILIVPRFCFLRDHNGHRAYKLLFLCKPYHKLSAIKDIDSFSLVFYGKVILVILKSLHCVKSVQIRENRARKNSVFGHFSRTVVFDTERNEHSKGSLELL